MDIYSQISPVVLVVLGRKKLFFNERKDVSQACKAISGVECYNCSRNKLLFPWVSRMWKILAFSLRYARDQFDALIFFSLSDLVEN